MKSLKIIRGSASSVLLLSALIIFTIACEMPQSATSFSLMSYNVQTLFDDRNNGGEFSEFVPSADGWNTKKYHNRLRQLSRILRDIIEDGPDIVVLQEVENEDVVRDLDRFFIRDLNYRYLSINETGSQSLAILSRIPVIKYSIVAVQWEDETLRPMLELHVQLKEAGTNERAIVYAVHWKSKREGAEETEILRRAAAHALLQSIEKNTASYPNAHIIVAGDFNENIDEFLLQERKYITALMPIEEASMWQSMHAEDERDILPLFVESYHNAREAAAAQSAEAGITQNAEPSSEGAEGSNTPQNADLRSNALYHFWQAGEGSYVYNGQWERIDSILISQSMLSAYRSIEFSVADIWYLLDSSDRPRRYDVRNSSGYSDHLPILMRFSFE